MLDAPPIVGLLGAPAWGEQARRLLQAGGFVPVTYALTDRWLDALLDRYPALLLADATQPDWATRVTALKADQATRRVPVLVIAAEQAIERAAQALGADGILWLSDLDRALVERAGALVWHMDAATRARLDCQCAQSLPPLGWQGVQHFNAGEYYAQHDAFEAQWMAERGPVRELYRAILQVGVAYYHLTRGNHAGALRMLRRSAQWFARLPDVCQGVDVRQLQQDAARVRRALQELPPTEIARFDRALLRPIRLIEP
jgi:predicted metal-dependent hydrolase